MSIREKIYNLTHPDAEDSTLEKAYNVLMIVAIIVSIIPLCFKGDYVVFKVVEIVTVSLFILDYIMRWITADYQLNDKSVMAFVKYPFTPMAIIDLLSILPSLTVLNNGFKAFRLLRLMRALRVIRVFKTFRYSKNVKIIWTVFVRQRDYLLTVLGFAIAYVFISAIVIYQVEPETFGNFFDALYWATISLTTVGYGDIFAVSSAGRFITMISAFVGIAIVALPAGILTAGYMEEVQKVRECNEAETKQRD